MAIANIGDIAATTLRNRTRQAANNVENNNALLKRLNQRGFNKPFSGGRTILHELDFAENTTYKRYSGYEVLDVSQSRVHDAAEYAIKQAAVAITISGLEELMNSSEAQAIDLLEARIQNAERTFANNMSIDVYSDGQADGGKQVGGLQLLVSDTPTTGVVGGIDRAVWTFWQNQVETGVTGAANIVAKMQAMFLKTARGPDKVDLIVADNVFYTFYWDSLLAIQRINSPTKGQAGFIALDFMGADVMYDGGIGGAAPASHMYFLNTDYIHYRPHSARNMVPLSPNRRYATNQDAEVQILAWAGNLTCSGRQFQGRYDAVG